MLPPPTAHTKARNHKLEISFKLTCRMEVLKMNSFQSRKGTRPVCRMSSRELLEGGITQGTEAGDLSPTGPLFNKEYLCSGEDFPVLFCAVALSCPCILQVHSAETHPRALHSEHIKAHASPCACVSQQCQPMPLIRSALQQGYGTAPQHGSGLPDTERSFKNITE